MADESPRPSSTFVPEIDDEVLVVFAAWYKDTQRQVERLHLDRPESDYVLLAVKDAIARLDERMATQEQTLEAIASELRMGQQAMLSTTQFWAGIGVILAVLLSLAGIFVMS